MGHTTIENASTGRIIRKSYESVSQRFVMGRKAISILLRFKNWSKAMFANINMPANLETWPKPRKKPNYDNESRTYILHLHPLLLTIFCFLLCQCINILVNSK